MENLARYAEGDVKGQLETFDSNDNCLIEYDWGAMTGNDADAVSFHWREGDLDRAESAYQYSGAMAAAEAYELIGDTAKADEMRSLAEHIQTALTDVLWNPESQLFEHVHVESGDHVPWKEINNYYPFSVGAIPNEAPYTDALRLFEDPAEYPVFPFYTANQADKEEAAEQGDPRLEQLLPDQLHRPVPALLLGDPRLRPGLDHRRGLQETPVLERLVHVHRRRHRLA